MNSPRKNSRRGHILRGMNRQVWLLLVSQGVWMALLFSFFAWWGHLLSAQSRRIAELELAAGIAPEQANAGVEKMSRIVFWEAGTMFLLVALISIVIVWFFARDSRRARSVQTFFAGVTHELRTPMTGIRLQAESIVEKTSAEDSTNKLAQRLIKNTGQLEGHLQQILELARIEGGQEPQLQTVVLAEAAKSFLDDWSYQQSAAQPSIELVLGELAVNADPVALQTILRNLFDNSLRHGGRDDIAISLKAESQEGGNVLLSYQDNGQGFHEDPAELEQVFVKGKSSDGSGVGLYLICALMRQMGGDVEFVSRDGFNAVMQFEAGENHA